MFATAPSRKIAAATSVAEHCTTHCSSTASPSAQQSARQSATAREHQHSLQKMRSSSSKTSATSARQHLSMSTNIASRWKNQLYDERMTSAQHDTINTPASATAREHQHCKRSGAAAAAATRHEQNLHGSISMSSNVASTFKNQLYDK